MTRNNQRISCSECEQTLQSHKVGFSAHSQRDNKMSHQSHIYCPLLNIC